MIVNSLNVGKPRQILWQGRLVETSIYKQPVSGPLPLHQLDFEGNLQADLVNHGGSDKAVNAYFHTHYAHWERVLGRRLPPGAFGENLTLAPGDESDVCIGDVYNVGDAQLEVSQPRIPCYKVDARHDRPGMAGEIVELGYTGFYFRVRRPGAVASGATLELVERPHPRVTVAFANRVLHHDVDDSEGLHALLAVPALANAWRKILTKRL